MIPWPTTLVDRIGFPLQLTSSAFKSFRSIVPKFSVNVRVFVEALVWLEHWLKPVAPLALAERPLLT